MKPSPKYVGSGFSEEEACIDALRRGWRISPKVQVSCIRFTNRRGRLSMVFQLYHETEEGQITSGLTSTHWGKVVGIRGATGPEEN